MPSPIPDLITQYNYDEFVPDKFQKWMKFHESPPLGQLAPDFPLWPLEDEATEGETSLKAIWSANVYTMVEFGSFT